MSKKTIELSPEELEELVRKVVREELENLLAAPTPTPPLMLDDMEHEGPEDAAEDQELLAEALVRLRQYRDTPGAGSSLGQFRRELARAEAAGELSD